MAQMVGAANLAAGLRDAHLACSPVLALTGGPAQGSRTRQQYQQVDDLPVFAPYTKFSASTGRVDRLPDLLHQAFRAATTGKPGPVHVELEGSNGETELAVGDLEVQWDERFSCVPPFRPLPESDAVSKAIRCLGEAERPVIVAGGGVRHSRSSNELLALAEALNIPIATSMNGKDVVPAGHRLSVGVVGLYSREAANRVVSESDLTFFIGSQTGSQTTFDWQVPPPGRRIIHLDIDPTQLGRHYATDVMLQGDAQVTLRALLSEFSRNSAAPDRSAWLDRVDSISRAWHAQAKRHLRSDAVPIRPERLCDDLSRQLPDDAIVVSDTGHAGMWTAAMLDLASPRQDYLRAAGSLGWALPAGLGAKLALPHRPVAIFTGDGGLWYHSAELETARRWNISAVIIVNNNRSLNQEIVPYTQAYDGDLKGRHAELWHFEDVDLARVAEAVGVRSVRITEPGALEAGLAAAFEYAAENRGPILVDVATDMEVTAPLAWAGSDEAAVHNQTAAGMAASRGSA
jgi:acetolactate synthase-1/2/3 large subunit